MLKSVKLGGEREEGNHILRSPCSLLVVECCVGWVSLCFLSTPCIIIIVISPKMYGGYS